MPVLLTASPQKFSLKGQTLLKRNSACIGDVANRRFRAMFGVTPALCSRLWGLLLHTAPLYCEPKHLLWTLLFLKVYASEHVNQFITGADEKTYRKWVWIFAKLISHPRLIRWDSRLVGRSGCIYKASVDGVDVPIFEPGPFDPKWFSHKFKGPGLRYEVGLSIYTGNICWAFGPFPAGTFSDLKIYKLGMKRRLLNREKVVADGAYKDDSTSYGTMAYARGRWSYIRARHEAFNKHLKQFGVLKHRFRHPLYRHANCFHAVANITYLLVESGEIVLKG